MMSCCDSSSRFGFKPFIGLSQQDDDQEILIKEEDSGTFYSVETAIDSIGMGKFQYRIIGIVAFLSCTDAMEMMLLAVLSPPLRCYWMLSDVQVALITTCVFIGMSIGALFWGYVADKFGRWNALFLSSINVFFYGFLSSLSPSYVWMAFLRALVGFSIAGAAQGSTLLAEYLPSSKRATSYLLLSALWTVGTFLEISLAFMILPNLTWRWLIAVSSIPIGLSIVFFKFLPESVRFLLAAGREGEAKKILEMASKINKTTLPEGRLLPIINIEKRAKVTDFFNPGYKVVSLIIPLMWFVFAFSYYGMVLASSEISNLPSCTSTDDSNQHVKSYCAKTTTSEMLNLLISTLGEFLSIPINCLILSLIGRKWSLTVILFFNGVLFAIMAICMNHAGQTTVSFFIRASTTVLINTVYLYTIEVYPTVVRGLALGIGSFFSRIGGLITPFVGQVLLRKSVTLAMVTYSLTCFGASLSSLFLTIETRYREMPQNFR